MPFYSADYTVKKPTHLLPTHIDNAKIFNHK